MSSNNVSTLQQWAQEGRLREAQLNDDGSELTLLLGGDMTTLPATEKAAVTLGDSSCEYTLASIFLYIVNPDQSLVEYRKACRTHKVADPVKVSDKNTVLGYFLPAPAAAAGGEPTEDGGAVARPEDVEGAAAAAEAASQANAADGAAAHGRTAEASDERRKDRKPSSRSHRDKDRSGSDSKHGRSASRSDSRHRASSSSDRKRDRSSQDDSDNRRKEKARRGIDPEKLFSNLSGVVGKREIIKAQQDAEQAELHKALSPDGFAVTQEVLREFQKQTASIMAHEIAVGNSSSILKAAAGKDLSRILKLYNETMAAIDKDPSRGGSGSKRGDSRSSSSAPSSQDQTTKSVRTYLIGKKPIIVVPKGMTAPITLTNAHEFFANSRFVPRDTMMQQLRSERAAPKTDFGRNVGSRLGGGRVEYELMDNPRSRLNTPRDWERVVAVVALGQPWQFKDWPGPYGEPAQLFGRTFGFYVEMEGDKTAVDVQGWSVTRSKLNRDKRGLDSVTYASFWNALDEWMTIHRPEMLPQKNNE